MRCRSKRLNGCVPDAPKRQPSARAISPTNRRSCAERAQHVVGGAADGRRHLEHRLHQLGGDVVGVLGVLDRGEHRVDVLHEIPGLGVEQHVLLLDAERVRVALAERVIQHARTACRLPSAPKPVIEGGKICCISGVSISRRSLRLRSRRSQRGSSSVGDDARRRGARPANASPCARPTSSISAASVT